MTSSRVALLGVVSEVDLRFGSCMTMEAGVTVDADGGAVTELEEPAASRGCGCDAGPGALAALVLFLLRRKELR